MSQQIYKILAGSTLPGVAVEEVGSKAWNLMRMAAAGLPVPPAFVLPTSWCRRIKAGTDEKSIDSCFSSGIAILEAATNLGFGSRRRPLLVSVRSGGAVSMPGMLETVLNIGVNVETVEGLVGCTGNPRLAWDCYRRLVQGYSEVVQGLPRGPFDEAVTRSLSRAQVESQCELDYRALRDLTGNLLELFRELAGVPFPEDPRQQLRQAALAVFHSWDSPKAVVYRKANGVGDAGGTAVTVQRMVFGNASGASGSGVAFTRNPADGAPELYLDFQFHAQGEDIVAGRAALHGGEALERVLPSAWRQLKEAAKTLEALFRDAEDFEFTIESGTLCLLQARSAKRTPWAALRIAVDQVNEGLINVSDARSRLTSIDLGSIVRTRLANSGLKALVRAQGASIGVASGAIAFDSAAATRMASNGTPVILVRREAETADFSGMLSAAGILTAVGGRTSHAAVVARQLGKVCLVACPELQIDLDRRTCRIGDRAMHEGDYLSLDGNDGCVYVGQLEVITERPERELAAIESWPETAPQAS